MTIEDLRGKKIAILGLGVNNQKLADYLNRQNIEYTVLDNWKNPSELTEKILNFEIVFRTPGLPFLSEPIQKALAAGVEIQSQTKLFFDLCVCPIIGVTGTKGKGTASSLIAKMIEADRRKVCLGGNIGRDPFEFLEAIEPNDLVVLELSSFQLQDLNKSPHIAIVLSITPDHLDHHKNFEEYIRAKSQILTHQSSDDFAVLHPGLPEWFKSLGRGRKKTFNPEDVNGFKTKLLGRHNLENIAAAASAAEILKIDQAAVEGAVSAFSALPHRLNILRTVDGITYVDDAYSTNVEPTMAAIDALAGNLILIVGGHDKGLELRPLLDKIKTSGKIKNLVVIGQLTEKIAAGLKDFQGQVLTGASDMAQIVSQARSLSRSGDTVVFSPGTASFGMFKNETDRGEQFVKAVNAL